MAKFWFEKGVSLVRKKIISCLAIVFISLSAILMGMTSSPDMVHACSKGEVTTPEYDYSVASNVFYGTVTKVETVYYDGKPFRLATFVTEMNLKGRYVTTVLTDTESDRCGFTFELNHNYLVYVNNRLGYPAASKFDIFEGDEAAERLKPLKDMNMVPSPEPGEHRIMLYPGSDVTVTLNGKTIPVKSAPLYYKNILYVPMIFFRDTLGYVTVWNAESNRHEILLRSEWAGIAAKGAPSQSEFIGNLPELSIGTSPFEANVTYTDVQAKVDGNFFAPENWPINYKGVVYVPLRETAERLGIQVNWDSSSHTVLLKDTRPIDPLDYPVLIMKLSSNKDGEADLIVDHINNDQALYRVDRKLQYGENPEQLTAPFTALIKETDGIRERRIRLFLRAGERENELVMTEDLMNALLKDPTLRASANLTLNRDFYRWPDYGIIGISNIQ
jgi:hypothetical protein